MISGIELYEKRIAYLERVYPRADLELKYEILGELEELRMTIAILKTLHGPSVAS